ncbi:MAG: hypothetical protein AAB431_01535, partial [Patescibacteria group bacterium]
PRTTLIPRLAKTFQTENHRQTLAQYTESDPEPIDVLFLDTDNFGPSNGVSGVGEIAFQDVRAEKLRQLLNDNALILGHQPERTAPPYAAMAILDSDFDYQKEKGFPSLSLKKKRQKESTQMAEAA